jgi:hypothetical protein
MRLTENLLRDDNGVVSLAKTKKPENYHAIRIPRRVDTPYLIDQRSTTRNGFGPTTNNLKSDKRFP